MRIEYRRMLGATIAGFVLLIIMLQLRPRDLPVTGGRELGVFQDTIVDVRNARRAHSESTGLGLTRDFFLEEYSSLDFSKASDVAGQERFIGLGTGVVLELLGPEQDLTGIALQVRYVTGGEYIEKATGGLQYLLEVVNPDSESWISTHIKGGSTVINGQEVVLTVDSVSVGERWMTLSFMVLSQEYSDRSKSIEKEFSTPRGS